MTNKSSHPLVIDDWVDSLSEEKEGVASERAIKEFVNRYDREPDASDEEDRELLEDCILYVLRLMFTKEVLEGLSRKGVLRTSGVDEEGFYKYEIAV